MGKGTFGFNFWGERGLLVLERGLLVLENGRKGTFGFIKKISVKFGGI